MTGKYKETELGIIPEDWEVTTIKNFAKKIGSGITPRGGSSVYIDKGTSLIRSQNIYNSGFSEDGLVYIKDDMAIQMKGVTVKEGDVLLNITGDSVARCCIVPNKILPARVNQHVLIIRTSDKLNAYFLRYYMIAPRTQNKLLSFAGIGGTRKALTKSMIENFKIPYPSLPEQFTISKILSDLDSKIELLQKQNKTLEEMGKAIFKRWFIDFEFPNEQGKPYKSSGGKMVESEFGEIPKGWSVEKLSKYIDVQRGLSYKGKFLSENETDIPMVNLGTIAPHKGYRKEGIKFYTGEHKERHTIKTGDIVIANTDITQKRDVLGSPAIVPAFDSEEILFTHHIYAVRNKYFPNLFLYYLFQKPDYKERAVTFATGTTVLALPKDAILDYEFVIPTKEVFNKFGILAESIFNKIILNTKDLLSLQKTRDLLLPKLMSGKMRVPIEVRT